MGRFGTRLKTEFIKGIGRRDDRFIIIPDIDKAFLSDELALVQEGKRTGTVYV